MSAHPQLAELEDAGPSWEQTRHLWLMRLTSDRLPGPKPAIYLLAAQHARDVATPEMLLRYISYLTDNYGLDPDVTWLMDNRVVWVMPLVNPDGYNQIYYNAQCTRMKNMDSYICANPVYYGIDLNRNYPYQWNTDGISRDPCDPTYPGPNALSEPESQHVLDTFETSGAGLVLSLQAPGPSIRYPWGWSPDPPSAYCPRCATSVGLHEADAEGCTRCRGRRLAWLRAVRLGEYTGLVRDVVHEVKFSAWRRLGADAGRLLGEQISPLISGLKPSRLVLVPVPSTLRRRMARGIDHTLVIARGVQQVTGGQIIRALKRQHRPSQVGLSMSQRRQNVSGTMRLRRAINLGGCAVIVMAGTSQSSSSPPGGGTRKSQARRAPCAARPGR